MITGSGADGKLVLATPLGGQKPIKETLGGRKEDLCKIQNVLQGSWQNSRD